MDEERWRTQLGVLEQLRAQFVRLSSLRHIAGWRAARISAHIAEYERGRKNGNLEMPGKELSKRNLRLHTEKNGICPEEIWRWIRHTKWHLMSRMLRKASTWT